MMMSLGLFIFTLPTVVFQELSHKRDVRHAWNERIGATDAVQFIGPGTETMSLKGVTAYGINNAKTSFAILNAMMQSGQAFMLIDGLGNVFGKYVITSLDISKTVFQKFGQARRNEFTIELRRADNPGGAIRNILLDKALDAVKSPDKMAGNKLSIVSMAAKIAMKLPGLGG